MRCNHALNSLSPLLDGQLDAGALAGLDRHLQDCAPCMAQLTALRAADAFAQFALPEEPLSPTFVADLERRIAREGDLPQPAEGLTVRALIPMAAAVMLGATVTFLGMNLGRRDGTPPVGTPVVNNNNNNIDTDGTGDAAPLEHATGAAEVAADAATDKFAARADVLLTNLGHLSTRDAARELRLLQGEAEAVGLQPAMETAQASVAVIEQRDPLRAAALDSALDGTWAILRRLESDGAAGERILGARREMLKRQLREVIDRLAPNGMPRPRRDDVVTAGHAHGNDPASLWTEAFRHYRHGDLPGATVLFEKVAAASPDPDQRDRAAYWVAKTSLLEGKPHVTLKLLPQVRAFSPDGAAELSKQMGFVLNGGGGTIVIVDAGGEVQMRIESSTSQDSGGADDRARRHQRSTAYAKQAEEMRTRLQEMRTQMKLAFETMPVRERTQVRISFEAAELPTPRPSHYFFRTTAVRVDGKEVQLDGASKLLRDTTPIVAYRIDRKRTRRVAREGTGPQVFSFDVFDRAEDTHREITRRVQFGSWEAQQFITELQSALGTTLIDAQHLSTFQTIEFVVDLGNREGGGTPPVPPPPGGRKDR